MTVRHIGGGAKRKYRVIDFKREKIGVTGKVVIPRRPLVVGLYFFIAINYSSYNSILESLASVTIAFL